MWKYLLLLLCLIEVRQCGVTASSESNESTSETDSPISKSTTTNLPEEEITTVTIKPPNEEAKLPVDLLSDDVLLDPNVVLARLSRRDLSVLNSKWIYQPHQYNLVGGHRQPNRRIYSDHEQSLERRKKFKVYPVFPGK